MSFCYQRRLVAYTDCKLFLPPLENTTTFPFPKGISTLVHKRTNMTQSYIHIQHSAFHIQHSTFSIPH